MRALLLSAGLGTRLKPLTDLIPKGLVPVKGKPLMEYWLDMLCSAHIVPVLTNLHYFARQVDNFIKTSPYEKYINTVYEEKLLGTGGTLLEKRNFFREITILTFESDSPETCGIVELDKDNIVCGFHEKAHNPPGKLANGAVYIYMK